MTQFFLDVNIRRLYAPEYRKPLEVKYDNHRDIYLELAQKIKREFGDILQGTISPESLIMFERKSKYIVKKWWQLHPKRSLSEMEMKFALAYLANDEKIIEKAISGIHEYKGPFLERRIKRGRLYFIDWIEYVWKKNVFEIFSSREHFLSICEETLKNRQVSSLNFVSLKQ